MRKPLLSTLTCGIDQFLHHMDLFEQTRGRPSPRPGFQLQGPRPSPLKVNKDSHKLMKKPSFPPPAAAPATSQRRPPVIIYTVSPKIIHTKPSEFMSLVQRLTGCTSSESSPPAAPRLPAAENSASPKQNSPSASQKEGHDADELQRLVIGGGSTMTEHSAGMQLMSQNFFSPSVVDINQLNFFHELNVPALNGGNKGIMGGGFMATPGNFFFSL